MNIVIFGLTITSSWGNGHATLWRALCRALVARKHHIVFFERDTPYYAAHRDLTELPGIEIVLYSDWSTAWALAEQRLESADVGMVTSYCPDALAATEMLLDSRVMHRVFYDLDTPVTLERLSAGEDVAYIGPRKLRDFDLVLSYTGGRALDTLRDHLGAQATAPLFGSVDPDAHRPVPPHNDFRADLSYLGTYAADRQLALETLFIEPARQLKDLRFVIGGAQYPHEFPWAPNIYFVRHVAPPDHPAFFCSSRLTLNVTRKAMAEMGYCPSGRLFEAAACGVPLLSDAWEGLEAFYSPGEEIILAQNAQESISALSFSDGELTLIARRARERTLTEHTAARRAIAFEGAIDRIGINRGDRDRPVVKASANEAQIASLNLRRNRPSSTK